MSNDLRALLAAIVADPADDTARLVYADCLQDHGNADRADFIRYQIEAERLHPDSNARLRLEEQAKGLLLEHWIDWWGEVCAAVGLPVPVKKPAGALGRLARRVGIVQPVGHPYDLWGFKFLRSDKLMTSRRLDGWLGTTFHRGFPDSFDVMLAPHCPRVREVLKRWPGSGPLAKLGVAGSWPNQWREGPHLAGVHSLTLWEYDPTVLFGALNSPHLTRLIDLRLQVPEYEGDGAPRPFAGELAGVVALPRVRQLRHLQIPVWDNAAAEVVARATNLAELEALEIELDPGDEDLAADASRRFAMLARAPCLSGLRELKVIGGLHESGIEAAIRNPTWTGLRKLDIDSRYSPLALDALNGPDDLSELDELRVSGISYTAAGIAALVRSPLLKRLRHFAVRGGPPRSADIDIADAVDPDRIETFAIGNEETFPRLVEQLRVRFGDRLRILY